MYSNVGDEMDIDSKDAFSKTNLILFGLYALIQIIIFFKLPVKSSYYVGYYYGGIVATFLIAYFISKIIWKISGKNIKAKHITFNIITLLFVLSIIGKKTDGFQNYFEMKELKNMIDTYRSDINENIENLDIVDSIQTKIQYDYLALLKKQYEESASGDTLFYRLMYEYALETYAAVSKWDETVTIIYSAEMLDISKLNNLDEINLRYNMFEEFILYCNNYKTYTLNTTERLEEKLSPLGKNNEIAQGAIMGTQETFEKTKQTQLALIDTNIELGKNSIDVLNILKSEFGKWALKDDFIVFENEDISNKFFDLLYSIEAKREKIISLTGQLIRLK